MSVHILTATGAIIGLLAFAAASREEWRTVFLLMLLAMLIDAFDGSLARKLKVRELLPSIYGALMDNLVDFLNYSVLPAYVLLMSPVLPENFRLVGASMVLVASAFQFSHVNAKTTDHFFRGFPSYWNLLVIYLSLLEFKDWTNLGVVTTCAVLTFIPIYYVYPSRTPILKNLTLGLSLPWLIMMLAALLIPASLSYPVSSDMVALYSLYYIIYYLALSFYLTARRYAAGKNQEPKQEQG